MANLRELLQGLNEVEKAAVLRSLGKVDLREDGEVVGRAKNPVAADDYAQSQIDDLSVIKMLEVAAKNKSIEVQDLEGGSKSYVVEGKFLDFNADREAIYAILVKDSEVTLQHLSTDGSKWIDGLPEPRFLLDIFETLGDVIKKRHADKFALSTVAAHNVIEKKAIDAQMSGYEMPINEALSPLLKESRSSFNENNIQESVEKALELIGMFEKEISGFAAKDVNAFQESLNNYRAYFSGAKGLEKEKIQMLMDFHSSIMLDFKDLYSPQNVLKSTLDRLQEEKKPQDALTLIKFLDEQVRKEDLGDGFFYYKKSLNASVKYLEAAVKNGDSVLEDEKVAEIMSVISKFDVFLDKEIEAQHSKNGDNKRNKGILTSIIESSGQSLDDFENALGRGKQVGGLFLSDVDALINVNDELFALQYEGKGFFVGDSKDPTTISDISSQGDAIKKQYSAFSERVTEEAGIELYRSRNVTGSLLDALETDLIQKVGVDVYEDKYRKEVEGFRRGIKDLFADAMSIYSQIYTEKTNDKKPLANTGYVMPQDAIPVLGAKEKDAFSFPSSANSGGSQTSLNSQSTTGDSGVDVGDNSSLPDLDKSFEELQQTLKLAQQKSSQAKIVQLGELANKVEKVANQAQLDSNKSSAQGAEPKKFEKNQENTQEKKLGFWKTVGNVFSKLFGVNANKSSNKVGASVGVAADGSPTTKDAPEALKPIDKTKPDTVTRKFSVRKVTVQPAIKREGSENSGGGISIG